LEGDCSADLTLKWMTEVGSSIYATPLITDLYSDGHKDIIVPSFVHYLEVSRTPSRLPLLQPTLSSRKGHPLCWR